MPKRRSCAVRSRSSWSPACGRGTGRAAVAVGCGGVGAAAGLPGPAGGGRGCRPPVAGGADRRPGHGARDWLPCPGRCACSHRILGMAATLACPPASERASTRARAWRRRMRRPPAARRSRERSRCKVRVGTAATWATGTLVVIVAAGCRAGGGTAAGGSPQPAHSRTSASPVPSSSPTPPRAASSAPTPSAKGTGCTSLVVSASIKAAVTRAYGMQSRPKLVHIAPVRGSFYFGKCGGTFYAATRFEPTADATLTEQVALQDEGAAMKYFSETGSSWRYIASDGVPASPRGCAAIHRIPARLAQLWDDCRAGEP